MTLPRAIDMPSLAAASRRASDGDLVVPTLVATALVALLEEALALGRRLLVAQAHAAAAVPGADAPWPCPGALSRREAEVLRLLATGRSNRQIAHDLCLSPRTVQRHVANLYPKLGAHCRAEATAYALRHGLA